MNAAVAEQPRQQVMPRTGAESDFALAVRKAKAITSSSLVPESYRGEQNLGNAMIALEVAERTGASPLMVMQNLYVVHGRPSWSSTFLIATVNACGRFTPLRFETIGAEPEADDYRVRAVAKDRESGEVLEGPWITWKMVKAEGWHSKNGSKWKTIPALMFNYRAAAFWSRLYAPELSLGIHTSDEMQDTYATPAQSVQRADLADLQAKLRQRAAIEHEPEQPATPEPAPAGDPAPTAQEVHDALVAATTIEALDAAADLIRALPESERGPLGELYAQRSGELQ